MWPYYGHMYDSLYGDVTMELRGLEWLRGVLVLRNAIWGRTAMGHPLTAMDARTVLSSSMWRYEETASEALASFLAVQHWWSRANGLEVDGYTDFPLVRNGAEES